MNIVLHSCNTDSAASLFCKQWKKFLYLLIFKNIVFEKVFDCKIFHLICTFMKQVLKLLSKYRLLGFHYISICPILRFILKTIWCRLHKYYISVAVLVGKQTLKWIYLQMSGCCALLKLIEDTITIHYDVVCKCFKICFI